MMRTLARLVAARDLRAPPRERAPPLGFGSVIGVRDVVHRSAERVDGVERVAPPARERQERVVEVRLAPARETRADLRGALHAVAAESDRCATYPCSEN